MAPKAGSLIRALSSHLHAQKRTHKERIRKPHSIKLIQVPLQSSGYRQNNRPRETTVKCHSTGALPTWQSSWHAVCSLVAVRRKIGQLRQVIWKVKQKLSKGLSLLLRSTGFWISGSQFSFLAVLFFNLRFSFANCVSVRTEKTKAINLMWKFLWTNSVWPKSHPIRMILTFDAPHKRVKPHLAFQS